MTSASDSGVTVTSTGALDRAVASSPTVAHQLPENPIGASPAAPQARYTASICSGLREGDDVYPAMPEQGYGEAKLFGECLCRYFAEDFGLGVRVARYHSIFGPHGTWEGGREKAPAALCRKIAAAALTGNREIEIWGDGEQQRSFLYISDCIDGTLRLMRSGYGHPVNIGSARSVTINQLVSVLEEIAGVLLRRRYIPGPLGVKSRSSDNTLARRELQWEPSGSLEDGIERTYRWIYDQVKTALCA
jgi:GDP-D-mannose 3', 5'-epimerase